MLLHADHQPDALGIHQQAQGSYHRNPSSVGFSSGQTIIEHGHNTTTLTCQHQHIRFTGTQVMLKRHRRDLGRRTYRQPFKRPDIRQIDSGGFALLNLAQNGRRNNHAPDKSRQEAEQTKLMQILKRRRVADDFRQGGFLS